MTCQCQAGFFVLHTCDNPAVLQCTGCGRAMCHLHAATALPAPRCYDCRARGEQESSDVLVDDDLDTSAYDDNWAYRLRDRYHAEGSRYDARDAGAFVTADREIEDLDEGQGGFGDS